MKLSKLINELSDIKNKYGDIQVYAFGKIISSPKVYVQDDDDAYVNFNQV